MEMNLQVVASLGALAIAVVAWIKTRDVERLRAMLREQEGIRLRLFEEATKSLRTAETALIGARDEMTHAVRDLQNGDPDAARERLLLLSNHYLDYSGAGLLIPPDLDEAFDRARDAILRCNGALRELCASDDPIRKDDTDDATAEVDEALEAYRKASRAWKRRGWERFAAGGS